MKGLVCGWGVNDADYQIQVRKPYWADGKKKYKSTFNCPYYRTWLRMLERCHTETYHLYHPSYRGTSVCEDWKYFMSKWDILSQDCPPSSQPANDKDFTACLHVHASPHLLDE
ncbi:hypothetical protein LU687_011465 [Pseudomonas asiatica]|uniref:hypothetical protein n=1 Tax=Pseudomonas asiatica TaxID=2219225 RepID=UPI0025A5F043|nr:hypothetical protein [Pseudomonas asiatica]WJR24966.1 hypothetical protein LU687_011465 [Pseudomonas asiatica]